MLAGLILILATARAFLNYLYFVSVNKLVQQRLVVDLRGQVYDRLQRLSFRFFDANTTGSIITRVTSDVQSVRMFVDQVLIQSVIMVISLYLWSLEGPGGYHLHLDANGKATESRGGHH
jgi:ATP-binding cassette subfamily B protein